MVAISDAKTALYQADGLDLPAVQEASSGGGLSDVADVKQITNSDLLLLPVDVLIPAAISHQITTANVDYIKVKIILEMANDPVTVEADMVLQKQGVVVIPDILANAGGVMVSYFEWIQNSSNDYWSLERVYTELETRITAAFSGLLESTEDSYVALRSDGYRLAIDRIIKAERARGRLS